jgi:hypothetical protein
MEFDEGTKKAKAINTPIQMAFDEVEEIFLGYNIESFHSSIKSLLNREREEEIQPSTSSKDSISNICR